MILKNKEGKKTKYTSDCIEIKGNDGNEMMEIVLDDMLFYYFR